MSRRRIGSPLFAQAIEQWRELRAEYEDHRVAAYLVAEEACRGAMLNARGRRAQIDALSLFMGTEARAHAYASPELIEHWATHPRVTFAQFERQRGVSWVA